MADDGGPAGLPLSGMKLVLLLAMLPIFEVPASQGMIPESGYRFSEKITLKQRDRAPSH